MRRVQSLLLVFVLCLPATSLAVLYTCTMDGLTRMSNCEEHGPAMMPTAEQAGHDAHGASAECEMAKAPAAATDGPCCEIHVVTASLETAPALEVPSPSRLVVYLEATNDGQQRTSGFAGSVETPPWRGPPLYERFASFLI